MDSSPYMFGSTPADENNTKSSFFWPPSFSRASNSDGTKTHPAPTADNLDAPLTTQVRSAQSRKESIFLSGMDFQFHTILPEYLNAFRNLNLALFPVTYHKQFYQNVLYHYPVLLSRIGSRLSNLKFFTTVFPLVPYPVERKKPGQIFFMPI